MSVAVTRQGLPVRCWSPGGNAADNLQVTQLWVGGRPPGRAADGSSLGVGSCKRRTSAGGQGDEEGDEGHHERETGKPHRDDGVSARLAG